MAKKLFACSVAGNSMTFYERNIFGIRWADYDNIPGWRSKWDIRNGYLCVLYNEGEYEEIWDHSKEAQEAYELYILQQILKEGKIKRIKRLIAHVYRQVKGVD